MNLDVYLGDVGLMVLYPLMSGNGVCYSCFSETTKVLEFFIYTINFMIIFKFEQV